jgi:hypothetical protein
MEQNEFDSGVKNYKFQVIRRNMLKHNPAYKKKEN